MVRSHTLLKLLKTLEGDLEDVLVAELGRVVEDVDPEKRYDRHLGGCVVRRLR